MGQNLTRVSVLMQPLYSYCLRPFWSDTLRPSYNPCGFAYRLTLCSEREVGRRVGLNSDGSAHAGKVPCLARTSWCTDHEGWRRGDAILRGGGDPGGVEGRRPPAGAGPGLSVCEHLPSFGGWKRGCDQQRRRGSILHGHGEGDHVGLWRVSNLFAEAWHRARRAEALAVSEDECPKESQKQQ